MTAAQHVGTALAFAALLALATTHAATDTMARRPDASAPAWPQTSLLAAAGDARFELAVNPTSFLAGQDPTSRTTFDAILRDGARSDMPWQRVFAGALQVRHQQGDEGETLWFNPVFDSGLLVRWHRGGSTWIAVSARWLLGREIRDDAPGTWVPLPIQAVDVSRFNANFAAVASTTLERAAAPLWVAPVSVATDGAELRARVAAAQGALTNMQKARGYRASFADAHRLLARIDSAGPRPSLALVQILDRLGLSCRATLQPVSAYRRGQEGWTLVLQSPFAPGVAVLVHFLDARKGSATITRVSVADYTRREER